MTATLAETIAETLSFIERALARVENGEALNEKPGSSAARVWLLWYI